MKHHIFSTALLAVAFTSTAYAVDDPNFGAQSLRGEIGTKGVFLTIPYDEVRYGNGDNKAYIKPEEYKMMYSDSIGGKVTCPAIKGPGLKGLNYHQFKNGIECSWKSRPGSNAEIITFTLMPGGDTGKSPKHYRGKNKVVTWKGTIYDANGQGVVKQGYKATLKLDMYDYRNGNSHKAFVFKKNHKVKLGDFTSTKGSIRDFICDFNGQKINVLKGHAPVGQFGKKGVKCTYMLKQNGKDPHYYGEVVFK